MLQLHKPLLRHIGNQLPVASESMQHSIGGILNFEWGSRFAANEQSSIFAINSALLRARDASLSAREISFATVFDIPLAVGGFEVFLSPKGIVFARASLVVYEREWFPFSRCSHLPIIVHFKAFPEIARAAGVEEAILC